jgi:hypothetical protein
MRLCARDVQLDPSDPVVFDQWLESRTDQTLEEWCREEWRVDRPKVPFGGTAEVTQSVLAGGDIKVSSEEDVDFFHSLIEDDTKVVQHKGRRIRVGTNSTGAR